MAVLSIRNIPDEVHALLRVRAAKAGRSMESEARDILTRACHAEGKPRNAENLQKLVAKLYKQKKPRSVVKELIRSRRKEAKNE